jgi:hypothetical protein
MVIPFIVESVVTVLLRKDDDDAVLEKGAAVRLMVALPTVFMVSFHGLNGSLLVGGVRGEATVSMDAIVYL